MGNVSLGKKLKSLRKSKHETQQQVADSIGCTIKTYREWELDKYLPRSDYLHELVKHFDVDMDNLIGRIEESTHDKKFIREYTGLSEKAIDMLHHLKQYGNAEEQQTISFINRVLSDPSKTRGYGILDITLFSWLEQYVTLSSVNLYDLNPEGRERVYFPAFELTSGMTTEIKPAELFQQWLMNIIRDTLEAYRKEEEKK